MIAATVLQHNLAERSRLFTVFHTAVPEGCNPEEAILIPSQSDALVSSRECYLLSRDGSLARSPNSRFILLEALPPLDDGDILFFNAPEKKLEVLWQVRSSTNVFFLTPACHSRCQFCPQPPTSDSGECYEIACEILRRTQLANTTINITGGEPTLNPTRFLSFLKELSIRWPTVRPTVLTNGRTLADARFVQSIFAIQSSDNIAFAIPLYADAAALHDKIVGVPGAFGETIRGLYNLARYHADIELRFVVSRLSVQRLPNLMAFVGANLPFVTRIAVMGIEPMGMCRQRWSDFWVDPEDCVAILLQAYQVARRYGLRMVLYNFQLCCLPSALHPIAYATISEWKRVFMAPCRMCSSRSQCGGFFASQDAAKYLPRHYQAMLQEVGE